MVKGASLAAILVNLWLKQYETALSREIPEMFIPEKYLKGICPQSAIKRSRTGQKVWNENAVLTGITYNAVIYQMISNEM